MTVLVIYDITSDRLRRRVSIICKNFGMDRIQKSAFSGNLDHERRQRFEKRIYEAVDGIQQYDVKIFPICDADLKKLVTITDEEPAPEKSEAEQLGIFVF